jgi:hypothetical protein
MKYEIAKKFLAVRKWWRYSRALRTSFWQGDGISA